MGRWISMPGIEERMEAREAFNIRYDIIGRVDGRWVIQAFDRNDQPLTERMVTDTPDEAFRLWFFLNGYGSEEPVEISARRDLQRILEARVSRREGRKAS